MAHDDGGEDLAFGALPIDHPLRVAKRALLKAAEEYGGPLPHSAARGILLGAAIDYAFEVRIARGQAR